MSLRQQLKRETAPEHQLLEERLALTGDTVTLGEYVHYLACTYRYYAAVEPVLRASAHLAALGLDTASSKQDALARDLAFFGKDTPSAPAPEAYVPPHDAIPELLGCCYVFEGAALGGLVLYRQFENRFGLSHGSGAAFLYGEGRDTARRWACCVEALDRMALTPAQEQACIGAARATFRGLDQWYAQNGWA